MANELRVQFSLEYNKSNTKLSKNISNYVTVSGTRPLLHRQSIGTSEESLAAGDVSTPGFLFIRNLDSSNYVEYSRSSGTPTGSYVNKLKAGEFAFHRVSGTDALYAKANTAAVDVEYILIPN